MSKTSQPQGKKSQKQPDKPKRVTGHNTGPQGFLVDHGEKLAFGAFGLVVLLCLYGALSHEKYAKTPEELASALQQKKAAVEKNSPDSFEDFKSTLQVPPIIELATIANRPVGPIDKSLGPPPISPNAPTAKRGAVVYMTLEKLQAFYISEALAMTPADGKKKPDAKPEKKAKEKEKPKSKDDLLAPGGAKQPPGAGKQPGKAAVAGAKKGKEPGAVGNPKVVEGGVARNAVEAPRRGGVHAPDAEAKVFSGVLVVATARRKQQAELYRTAFENARNYDSNRDAPHYAFFVIERSEDGGKSWSRYVKIDGEDVLLQEAYWRIQEKFFTTLPEIVAAQHLLPFEMKEVKNADGVVQLWPHRLTVTPLPPILGRDWDERVAGGFPLIPNANQGGGGAPGGIPGGGVPGGGIPGGGIPGGGVPGGGIAPPGAGPGAKGPPGVGPGAGGQVGEGAIVPGGKVGRGQRVGGPPGVGPGAGGVGPGPIGRPGGGGPMVPGAGNVANPFGGGPKQGAGADMDNQPMGQVGADPNCDLLFRFFDFTVEEGKSYQYRVALVLENPNFGLPAGLLKDRSLSEHKYGMSALTEPSALVRISLAGSEVVAGPVRGGRVDLGAVDAATMIIRQRHRQNGAMVAHTFSKLEAGQILNVQAKNIKCEKAVGGVEPAPLAEFDFLTDETIVDLKGADRGPGEALLLDAGGRLHVRSEVPARKSAAKDPTDVRAKAALALTGGEGLSYANEAKRLEWVYNYQPPTNANAGGAGGQPGFGDLLKPQ